jgi:hypothetical protein
VDAGAMWCGVCRCLLSASLLFRASQANIVRRTCSTGGAFRRVSKLHVCEEILELASVRYDIFSHKHHVCNLFT